MGAFPSCLLAANSEEPAAGYTNLGLPLPALWSPGFTGQKPQNRKYLLRHGGHCEPAGILGNGNQARGCTTHHRWEWRGEPGACWEGERRGLHRLPPAVERDGDHIMYKSGGKEGGETAIWWKEQDGQVMGVHAALTIMFTMLHGGDSSR